MLTRFRAAACGGAQSAGPDPAEGQRGLSGEVRRPLLPGRRRGQPATPFLGSRPSLASSTRVGWRVRAGLAVAAAAAVGAAGAVAEAEAVAAAAVVVRKLASRRRF